MKIKQPTGLLPFTSLMLALSMLATARAQTNATVPISVPTQVIILGTLHGYHRANTNYSPGVLRDVIPYDREGRDEFYQKTRYSLRQQAADECLDRWIKIQNRQAPDSIPVLTDRLAADAAAWRRRLGSSGPEIINSPAYDMVVAAKHGIFHSIVPKLLAAAGEQMLSEEYLFFADEWQERNQVMARNVRDIARKFAGKRLVVLAGAEHRYLLRELLAKAPEVELKEFYQVPEWTNAQPTPGAGSTQKNADAAPSGATERDAAITAARNGAMVGIGVELEIQDGSPVIRRVFPGSPAELSGQLHPGDHLLSVAQGDNPYVDARRIGLQKLVQTIRGAPGTRIRLQVRSAEAPPDSPPRTVSLVRGQVSLTSEIPMPQVSSQRK
jgi:hypothetical protein